MIVLFTFSIPAQVATEAKHNFKPPGGYVSNAATAIKIAVAIWEPIYGAEQIAGERPYRATLRNGVWTVEGSLPKNMEGVVAVVEISKNNGKILRVSYGK